MKKKMIVSAFALAMFTTAGFAQNANTTNESATTATAAAPAAQAAAAQDEKKEQVGADALPQPIKTSLAADVYKDFKFVSAWHITGVTEYYVVELTKGDEKTTVKFDKEGKQMG